MSFKKQLVRISTIGLGIMILFSAIGALAAANTVPITYAGDTTLIIDQNQFIPYQCVGITFDNIIVGAGDINGGSGNDLIYGSSGDDNIRGGNGDDCILGWGGNDTLRGQNGDDILIGDSGYDIIEGGPGYDTCIFGDDVKDCEVIN